MSKLAAFEADLAATPPTAEDRFSKIWELISKPLDDFVHEAGGIDALVLKAQGWYDKYVAPADFPWFDDQMEAAFIDAPLKGLIESGLRRAHAAIHKPPVTP